MRVKTFLNCFSILVLLAAPAASQTLTDAERSQIESVSKQLTATAVMMLQEDGNLSRRQGLEMVSAADARERGVDSAVVVDDLGLPGLLAAGLRLHGHAPGAGA